MAKCMGNSKRGLAFARRDHDCVLRDLKEMGILRVLAVLRLPSYSISNERMHTCSSLIFIKDQAQCLHGLRLVSCIMCFYGLSDRLQDLFLKQLLIYK